MTTPMLALRRGSSILYLLNHDAATDYGFPEGFQLPAADVREDVAAARRAGSDIELAYGAAERTIPLWCTGEASGTSPEAALVELRRFMAADGFDLVWKASTDAQELWTSVRLWSLTEDSVNMIRRANGRIDVLLTLTTDEGWVGPLQTGTATVTAAPGTFTINDVPGDLPALIDLTLTSSAASSKWAVGVKPSPGAAFDPVDDYSGVTDANSKGGARSSDLTLSGTPGTVGSVQYVDSNDNRGSHLLMARVGTSSAAASLRANVGTSGSGISGESTYTVDPIVSGSTSDALQLLGEVTLPAGSVPTFAGTGVSYSPMDSDLFSRTASTTVASTISPFGYLGYMDGKYYFQSSDVTTSATMTTSGVIRSVSVKIKTTGNISMTYITVNVGKGAAVISGSTSLSPLPDPTVVTVNLSSPLYVAAGDNVSVSFTLDCFMTTNNAPICYVYQDNSAQRHLVLAGGQPISFDSRTVVQASGTGTAHVDYAVRIPSDYGALVVASSFGTNEGIRIDETQPSKPQEVYAANSTSGVGISVKGSASVLKGTLKPRPGDNTYVVVAGDAIGNVSAKWTLYPRYSDAVAGGL